ncbi:MAG: hypothetical protein V4543_17350 [Bacteroidota bacterium]
MKKYCIALLMLLCSWQGFGQKLNLTEKERDFINNYFLKPGNLIFEGTVINAESFRDETGTYGVATVKVHKSFCPGIACGEYKILTEPYGGKIYDTGKKTYSKQRRWHGNSTLIGSGLFSCSKLENGMLKIVTQFSYSIDGGNCASMFLGRDETGTKRWIRVEDFNLIYDLLPQPTVCTELKRKPELREMNDASNKVTEPNRQDFKILDKAGFEAYRVKGEMTLK